jgi:hypothetical protein
LRFLGIIFRVLRLEVSVYNVYITNQFQILFAQGGGGEAVKSVSRAEFLRLLSQLRPRIRPHDRLFFAILKVLNSETTTG